VLGCLLAPASGSDHSIWAVGSQIAIGAKSTAKELSPAHYLRAERAAQISTLTPPCRACRLACRTARLSASHRFRLCCHDRKSRCSSTSTSRKHVGDALGQFGLALPIERARPEQEVGQHSPPAHDYASHASRPTIEPSEGRLDEAERRPHGGVGGE